MGRHTMINPQTGRVVFKTGALGRKLQKAQKKKTTKKPAKSASKPKKTSKGSNVKASSKSYHGPGATKRASPLWKSNQQGGVRPSARAMYDMDMTGPVYYNGKMHVMDFRANGSPYYRPAKRSQPKCSTRS